MMKRLVFFLFLIPSLVFGAYTEFYVQTTGSNLNAGSTNTDSALVTFTNGNWDSTTGIFISTGADLSAVTAGMFASVYNDGATVAVFISRITAVNDSTDTITVSLTAKSGTAPTTSATGRSIKVGGAWQGPNGTVGFPFGFITAALSNSFGDGRCVNIKNGTNYAITAAMTHNVAGPTLFQGYTTSVRDGGRAVIDGGTTGASYVLLTVSGANNDIVDIIFQNNGETGTAHGFVLSGAECSGSRLVAKSVRGNGLHLSGTGTMIAESEAYGCNQSNTVGLSGITASASSVLYRCISHDNDAGSNANGFSIAQPGVALNCIADSNSGKGFYVNSTGGSFLINCDAYNNTGDGIDLTGASTTLAVIENCNLVKNGGWGINSSGSATLRNGSILNCGFGAGTQANTSGQIATFTGTNVTSSVTYANDVTPWVDPTNGDFRINLAAAKGTGRGAFTQTAASYTGTLGYPDIGASQHQSIVGETSHVFSQ